MQNNKNTLKFTWKHEKRTFDSFIVVIFNQVS